MPSSPLQLVWLKRDLRLCDHPALTEAARRGPVLPLFVIEPTYWSLPGVVSRAFPGRNCRKMALFAALATVTTGRRIGTGACRLQFCLPLP